MKGIVLFLGVLLIAAIVLLGRYDLVGSEGNKPYAYRMDRWSGKIIFIRGTEIVEVK